MENTTTNKTINQDVLKALRQISLIFFFIIGGTHIITGLLISQNLLMPVSNVINRVLDIPFAIIAIIFGLSQAKISSDSSGRKLYFVMMIIVCLLVLGLLLYLNLLLPDRTT